MADAKTRRWPRWMVAVPLAALGAAPPVAGPRAELLQGVELTVAGRIATVTVEADAAIGQLLLRHGVEPDGSALTVTYLLNPEVEDLGAVPAGTRLVLPAQPASPSGGPAPPLRLEVEASTKADLRAVQGALTGLSERFADLPAGRFATAEERSRSLAALGTIREILAELNQAARGNRLPLSPDLLREALAEARAVQSALEDALGPSDLAPPRPLEVGDWFADIAGDFAVKARSFDEVRGPDAPRRWRGAVVVVRLFTRDRRPVDSLRVYYAPRALVDRPQFVTPFGRLAAEVSQWLGEANYLIWAGRDGDPTPVTPRLPLAVRQGPDGKPIDIDLLVER